MHPRSPTRSALLLAACLFVATADAATIPGSGSPVKPRVMVIFDSSRSMGELPQFAAPTDIDVFVPMSDPLGDYDPVNTPNQACTNKFCTAKKVVYNTLPNYTSSSIIGLATYYQYILRYDPINTLATSCTYDKLLPAGLTRSFTSATDYNGSGGTVPGAPATNVFPEPLWSTCINTADTRYTLTKTAATPGMPQFCNVYSSRPPALPLTFSNSAPNDGAPTGCANNIAYETEPMHTNYGNGTLSTQSGYIEQSIGTGGAGCPAVVGFSGADPLGGPSVTTTPATRNDFVITGGGATLGSNNMCRSQAECALYSVNTAYVARNQARSWYGYFDNAPAVPTGWSFNGVTFGVTPTTGTHAAVDDLLQGTIVQNTPCAPAVGATQRVTAGTLAAYGIMPTGATHPAISGHPTLQLPAGSVDNSPASCSGNWPCDVEGMNEQIIDGGYTFTATIYNDMMPPQGPGELINNFRIQTSGSWVMRNPGGLVGGMSPAGSCPMNPLPSSIGMGGCGAGRLTCDVQFRDAITRTVSCSNQDFYAPGSSPSPATCANSGNPYTGPTVTMNTGTMSRNITSGACTTGTFTLPAAGGGYSGGGCGNYPCQLRYTTQTSTNIYSGYSKDSTNPNPGLYTTMEAPSTAATVWGPTSAASTNASCSGTGTTSYAPACSSVGGAPCTAIMSWQATGSSACGSEGNSPCYACRYQTQRYRWYYPQTTCNYAVDRYRWSADTREPICRYRRPAWDLWTQNPQQYRCTYSVPARRYDYSVEVDRICRYRAVQTQLRYEGYQFTYQYTTKGGELNGVQAPATLIPQDNYCAQPYPPGGFDNAAAGITDACPEQVANCDPMVPGTTCRLRWGGVGAGAGSGRYTRVNGNNAAAWCMASDGTGAAMPQPTPTGEMSKASWCSFSGSNPPLDFKLVSDWYGNIGGETPALGNAVPGPGQPNWVAQYNITGSNQASKLSGWGAIGGTPMAQPTPSQVFVTIPDDIGYNAASQTAALRQAMSKCELPSASNMSGLSWTPSGVCFSQTADHQAPAWPAALAAMPPKVPDFTPLYGSIKNTAQYLNDRYATDMDQTCRGYYIVLATDGLENTPANLGGSLQTLVGNQRNLSHPSTAPLGTDLSRPDIKTFVIGFGEGLSANPQLNNMAIAGGTGNAYFATDLNALQTALATVFNTITAGTFSRSKPALTSDGSRIYASAFTISSNTPEQKGEMHAYRINSDGTLTEVWEYSAKLNNQGENGSNGSGSRQLYSEISNNRVDFVAGNMSLLDRLDNDTGFPSTAAAPLSPMTPAQVVTFLRNPDLAQDFYAAPPAPKKTSRASAVIHSSAVVVGKSPLVAWGGTTAASRAAYGSYQASTSTRATRILFGANDGMLHAVKDNSTAAACSPLETSFSCSNGEEAWGFVPSELHLKLYRNLFGPQPGVDGQVTVSDVCPDNGGNATNCDSNDWSTIAVTGLREGGREVFALDISDPNDPDFLWDYTSSELGYTASGAVIGRVQEGGSQKFVAIFGGGLKGDLADNIANSVHVVNARTGNLEVSLSSGFEDLGSPGNQFFAQPAVFRLPVGNARESFLDSVVLPDTDGIMWVMRFQDKTGAPETNSNNWDPDPFFDPTSFANRYAPNGAVVPITKVVQLTAANPPLTPATYDVVADDHCTLPPCTLPLNFANGAQIAPSIYNRPWVQPVYDPTGLKGDYYVGTGYNLDPAFPTAPHQNYANVFYAVHDMNEQVPGVNDGRALFVHRFLDGDEQVVSNAIVVNGCVIVATYRPPTSTGCYAAGDTRLYSFNAKTGDLSNCLIFPPGSPFAGQTTSVADFANVGIPSDLVAVNNNLYFQGSGNGTSPGAPQNVGLAPQLNKGNIKSFRRVR